MINIDIEIHKSGLLYLKSTCKIDKRDITIIQILKSTEIIFIYNIFLI
jgi:hypothetical protein